MTSKEILNARIEAAQAFSKLFLNPLFHKDFLLLTETDSTKEYNTMIMASAEERIWHTLTRFVDSGETQASIVSVVDGEAMIRVVSYPLDNEIDTKVFDIYDDTTVYSWLSEENLHPEGIHIINGHRILVGGNIYRKNIEKLCGFTDN